MSVMAHSVSDGELLRRVGDGDGGAFETLYRRYSRPVFGLALRRLGDRGIARTVIVPRQAVPRNAGSRYENRPAFLNVHEPLAPG